MIYINGEYYKKEEAKISVYDHGLLYGDGIFEGIRVYNGNIFKLSEHIKRLFDSAKALYLNIGKTKEEIEDIVLDCVKKNKKLNVYIRLIITRGIGSLGIDPDSCSKSTIIVIIDDLIMYANELYEKGIKIITSTYRRIPMECFDVRIKSLNYLNNILAKLEAKKRGYFEALMLNQNGYVVECTADNIFIVKDNVLKTPDCRYGALAGITRETTLEIGEKIGIETEEVLLTRMDIYNADEVFLTGTGAEIVPVIMLDDITIGDGKPGKITMNILESFRSMFRC